MITTLKTMIRDEEGATMVEYGLLVALIALVAIVGVALLGTKLNNLFSSTAQLHLRGLRTTKDTGHGRSTRPCLLTHSLHRKRE